MKLELKHLAPYLPYGLKVLHTDWNAHLTMTITGSGNYDLSIEDVAEYAKPILRPMSDISSGDFTSDFFGLNEQKEEDYWLIDAIKGGHNFIYSDFQNLTYRTVEFLFRNHFDVFGLIEQGLAIDINTLDK